MQCPACDYENPKSTRHCLECGTRLDWTGKNRAEKQFRRELRQAESKAQDRLTRAGVLRGRRGEG